MSRRTLNVELDEAARLKIFGRDGDEYVSAFGMPGTNTIVLPDDAGFEQAFVNVEPLAGASWTQVIDFKDQPVASIAGKSAFSVRWPVPMREALALAKPLPLADRNPRTTSFGIEDRSSTPPLAPFFWTEMTPELASVQSTLISTAEFSDEDPRRSLSNRLFSFGLSTDLKPYDYGGWRAFEGPWELQISEHEGRVRIAIPRSEAGPGIPPEAGFRVRATLAVQRDFVQRFLLPFYGGGVGIELFSDGAASPRCDVRPIDPDRYALQQALEAGTEEEGRLVWTQFSAVHDAERFVRDDSFNDPWTVLLVLLAHDRFRSVALARPEDWCDAMASRFAWISDFLILQAHYALKNRGRMDSALSLLRRARKIGAPYFSASNRLLMRLLSSLAGTESSGSVALRAQAEMARWWRVLDNQTSAGVLFSWRMDNGRRTQGVLDKRYTAVIVQGAMSDGSMRLLANNATFTPSGSTPKNKEHVGSDVSGEEAASVAQPILQITVDPTTTSDQVKLNSALHAIVSEDPSLVVYAEPNSAVRILKGLSERQLREKAETLRRSYAVNARFGAPQVIYLETISRTVEIQYVHKRQTAGFGQFARVKILFEPGGIGSGFQFISSAAGSAVPKAFIPAVEAGLRSASERGLLAGYPLTDFKATLLDGAYHDVDSSERAFEIAARGAFAELRNRGAPRLIEPIMKIEVLTPSEFLAPIMELLSRRRGQILGLWAHRGFEVLTGSAPLARLLGYEAELAALSQGRVQVSLRYDHYEAAPPELSEERGDASA